MSSLKFGKPHMPNLSGGTSARLGDGWEPFQLCPQFTVPPSGIAPSEEFLAQIRAAEMRMGVELFWGHNYENDWRHCAKRSQLALWFLRKIEAGWLTYTSIQAAAAWLRRAQAATITPAELLIIDAAMQAISDGNEQAQRLAAAAAAQLGYDLDDLAMRANCPVEGLE